METENLKKELLQKIIACDDEAVLLKLNKILDNLSVAEDPNEEYEFKNYPDVPVPDLLYNNLKKEYDDFLNVKIYTKSWQEVKSTLVEKDGL